jgi:hypothetical protein
MQLKRKSKLNLFRASSLGLSLAIFLLALCVGVQAVGAKSSHYSGSFPQTVHFSDSVKIAKFIPLEVIALQVAAIPTPRFVLQEPRLECVLPVLEVTPVVTVATVSSIPLRSPPCNS